MRQTPSCGLGGEGFGVQHGLDKVANRCGGTPLCSSTKIGCCKPQFFLLIGVFYSAQCSCVCHLGLSALGHRIPGRVAIASMMWRHPAGAEGHNGGQWWLCYFCSKNFSFAVCMPQSVCVCCPVPTSKPLVMYMSTEHRPWASFGGSLPERRSPIRVMLCCKTGGSATMLKEATSDLVKAPFTRIQIR